METFSLPNVGIFILAVFPGLVSLQVYRLLMPARPLEWKDAVVQGLFYSVVNFALLFPIVLFVATPVRHAASPLPYWAAVAITLLIGPVLWPFLLRLLFRWRWLRPKIHLPYPTAWDYFFDSREPTFLLVRLKDGNSLGGYWGPRSFAGSFPNDGDIYLEAVYFIKPDGTFGAAVNGTRGALLRKDQYACIELFDIPDAGVEVGNVEG